MVKAPKSVVAAIGATACAFVVHAVNAYPRLAHGEGADPSSAVLLVACAALLVFGLVRGNRLAWQWGRVGGFVFGTWGLVAAVVGFATVGFTARFARELFYATMWWVTAIVLSRPSAIEHFNVACPACGARGASADLLFRTARCKACDTAW